MAVLLAHAQLAVRRRSHSFPRDAHGHPIAPATPAPAGDAYPGAFREQSDGTYTLRLDMRLWPVEKGDEITDGTLTWVVDTARAQQVPGVPDVDHIAVTATRNPPKVP